MNRHKPMWPYLLLIACVVLTETVSSGLQKDIVTLATATPGGGFPVYGKAFADAVNQSDPILEIQPKNTKGSTENVSLLESGQIDIALVQGEVANEVFSGSRGHTTKIRIITAMYASPGMFVVRADSPFHRIQDLIGKPVVFGAAGSGLVILARNVLNGIGLDQDRDFKAIYLDRAADGPAMIADGRASALWGGGIGWPGFGTVAGAPGGARFITPDEKEIARILAIHPFMRKMTVPSGSYRGQDAPLASVGSWSFVLARPDFPDDIAYRIARAIHRSEAELGARLPQAKQTTMTNTVSAAPRPEMIHPGVLRYLKEKGLIK